MYSMKISNLGAVMIKEFIKQDILLLPHGLYALGTSREFPSYMHIHIVSYARVMFYWNPFTGFGGDGLTRFVERQTDRQDDSHLAQNFVCMDIDMAKVTMQVRYSVVL